MTTRIMHTKVCEKCDSPMKLIPAGFSKAKNRPYSAFWSCDSRNGGCGATARAEGEAASAGSPAAANNDRLAAIEAKLDEVIALLKR